jgi:hypothetical protein
MLQVVNYHSSKAFRHRVDEVVVSASDGDPVPRGESSMWRQVALPVPSLPASFSLTDNCKVLDVEYRLDVSNFLNKFSDSLRNSKN